MSPFRRIALGSAVLMLLASTQVEAAWNNVFQTTCFGCRNRSSYYVAPAPVVAFAAPSSCCTTSYVQRCYYQPVTSYKTVLEPVTSYRTSYYYEPVCTYRSSCYYDPCTGSRVQVTQPVTSYRLRSQCNAVTSYVQRCVPVTSYRASYYLEPVTSCAPPPPCPPGATTVPPISGGVTDVPSTDGGRLPPQNVNVEESGVTPARSYRVEPIPEPRRTMPHAPTKLEHVVSRTTNGAQVSGQIVANNFVTPLRNAKLVFVSRTAAGSQQAIAADRNGRFQVSLAAGSWSIYTSRTDGSLDHHSDIDVAANQPRQVMVVSR